MTKLKKTILINNSLTVSGIRVGTKPKTLLIIVIDIDKIYDKKTHKEVKLVNRKKRHNYKQLIN
jgi:hypothetical protein